MSSLTLKALTELVMKQAKEKGFGTKPEDIIVAEKVALIHTEIAEAYEAYRHKVYEGKDSFQNELGDAVQRIIHLAAVLDLDLEKAILEKLELNKSRKWDFDQLNETQTR